MPLNLFCFAEALIIPSRNKRGQGMLVFRNYTYSWRNHKKNGSYWTCSSHHKKGCKANVTTNESKIPFRITKFHTKHNHPPPAIKIPKDIEYIWWKWSMNSYFEWKYYIGNIEFERYLYGETVVIIIFSFSWPFDSLQIY